MMEYRLFGPILAALVLIKITLAIVIGPIIQPDSGGYIQTAWVMVNQPGWWLQLSQSVDDSVFRPIGYPLAIALAKVVGEDHWQWLLIFLQGCASLVATMCIYRLALACRAPAGLAALIALAQGTGQAVVLDQCILTDSFNASLLLIVGCRLAQGLVERRAPDPRELLASGFLVFLAVTMREAGAVLHLLLWPTVIAWIALDAQGRARKALLLVCFALPILGGVQLYKAWNVLRTGQAFLTTGSSQPIFFPAIYLSLRGVDVLKDDPLLHGMGPLPRSESTVSVVRSSIIPYLSNTYGMSQLDIARYGGRQFLRLWLDYPAEMAKLTLSHIREKQAMLAVMPIESYETAVFWATWKWPLPRSEEIREAFSQNWFRPDLALLTVGRGVSRALSILITLAFVIGAPVLAIREIWRYGPHPERYDRVAMAFAGIWIAYFGYTFSYASIHLELRYLMPVEPMASMAGVLVLVSFLRWVHGRRARRGVVKG